MKGKLLPIGTAWNMIFQQFIFIFWMERGWVFEFEKEDNKCLSPDNNAFEYLINWLKFVEIILDNLIKSGMSFCEV